MRTQIILPKKLRERIDQARLRSGESMAEYLRRAAEDRLKHEQKQKVDLEKLADRVVGAVKNSSWSRTDVIEWQREIRRSSR